jgi:hypothetical protein
MKPIKDRAGKVLSYENDVSPYRKEIRDRSGGLRAYYNPKDGPEGKTFDRSGGVVGSGDQRGHFIEDGE